MCQLAGSRETAREDSRQRHVAKGERMGYAPSGTVSDTGAAANQVLIGVEEHPLNRGLRIKVHRAQPKGSGRRIAGSFELIQAGEGDYSRYLLEHVGESFESAAGLIATIREKATAAEKCKHILNCNKLRVEVA
jgi:hypothetical protein